MKTQVHDVMYHVWKIDIFYANKGGKIRSHISTNQSIITSKNNQIQFIFFKNVTKNVLIAI